MISCRDLFPTSLFSFLSAIKALRSLSLSFLNPLPMFPTAFVTLSPCLIQAKPLRDNAFLNNTFIQRPPLASSRSRTRLHAPKFIPKMPKMSETTPFNHDPYFGRVVTAMVTPFKTNDPDVVDYAVAEQLAVHLANNGSDALVIGGTTGESPTLTWSEQYELFTVVKNAVGSSVKIIAGAGSNSTQEAIHATKRAKDIGLDGTLQVVPYYNKPPPEGMYKHFEAIAMCEPDLPIMLYNIPGRTGINMPPHTVAKLSKDFKNIICIKEASGNLDQFTEIRKQVDPSFAMYAGDDGITLPLMPVGGTGVVSVASHFVGPQLQQMIKAFLEGDHFTAYSIHNKYYELFKVLFTMTNPICVKASLRMQGWNVGICRLPLTDVTPDVAKKLEEALQRCDLL